VIYYCIKICIIDEKQKEKDMKKNDLERVKKEVKAVLKPGLAYSSNLIKKHYLRYGYFVVGAEFSKTGKNVMIK
jgi:hypothetical protein